MLPFKGMYAVCMELGIAVLHAAEVAAIGEASGMSSLHSFWTHPGGMTHFVCLYSKRPLLYRSEVQIWTLVLNSAE